MIGTIPYIVKGIGGFYYVQTQEGMIECRAKGIFRKNKIVPTVGDYVKLECDGAANVIADILQRKNIFVRPPVANVDLFFIVVSTVEPAPSSIVIDKLAAIAVSKGAEPVLIITKTDLSPANELKQLYQNAGFSVIEVCAEKQTGLSELKSVLSGKCSVFCGNSGVGKSTLLSALLPDHTLETGEISKKLGRGKHTTREVTLYETYGGLVADTPGFASLDLERAANLLKEELQFCFCDIAPYINQCKFTGCSHLIEKGCAVRQAVQEGKIALSRYENYTAIYRQLKQQKEW